MKRSDFERGLREADHAAELPPDADARVRGRLFAGRRPARSFGWWLPVSAAAAALGVALLMGWPARPLAGGFEVHAERGASAELTAGGVVQVRGGAATLVDAAQGAELRVAAFAEVSRLGTGARVHRGAVRFEVAPTGTRAAPYQVEVSGGVIEVLGTAFTVEEHEGGGSVSLERGSIRFRSREGRVVALNPGQSVAWPLPEEPVAPPPTDDQPDAAPKVELAPTRTDDGVLEKVASLRSRGRYEEAVAQLNRALAQPGLSTATRERLDFEVGSILTHQLRDPQRACAHWAAHPSARYAVEVKAAVQLLRCEEK